MATKTPRKRATKPRTRRSSARTTSNQDGLLFVSNKGPWGKDQQMILIMAAGIIILIAVALFLTGWI